MNTFTVTSKGTSADTLITIVSSVDEATKTDHIRASNLQGVQLVCLPDLEMPQFGARFIGDGHFGTDGRLNELVGVNPGDKLDFRLTAEKDGDTYVAEVSESAYKLWLNGVAVVDSAKRSSGFSLFITADGFSIEFRTFLALVSQPAAAGQLVQAGA